jgi:phosphatidylglycerol:prolipoprotein diacylglycerol transferase
MAGGIITGSALAERQLVNGFAAAVTAACFAGLIWLGQADQWGMTRRQAGVRLTSIERIDGALISLGAGLLGARVVFVLSHWAYYVDHIWESTWFWQGGLSWAGGAIGAAAGLAIYAVTGGKPFLALADGLAAPLALFSVAGWIGCLVDGCAYGRQASEGWLTPASPDLLGNIARRWPTQSLGALLGAALLIALLLVDRKKTRIGMPICLTVSVLSASSLALEFLRADPAPTIAGLRLDAVGAGLFLAAGVIGMALLSRGKSQEVR